MTARKARATCGEQQHSARAARAAAHERDRPDPKGRALGVIHLALDYQGDPRTAEHVRHEAQRAKLGRDAVIGYNAAHYTVILERRWTDASLAGTLRPT